jgi:hypothetical protein
VGLERGPLSLVSTIEELPERKSSGSGLENREYGRRDPSHLPRGTLYPQKLALASPTSGGRSVGIVRPQTKANEFSLVSVIPYQITLAADSSVYGNALSRQSGNRWNGTSANHTVESIPV